jgi:hypothetical protein
MAVKHIKTWHYKAGYDVKYEEISGDEAGNGSPFIMRSAYTLDDDYIGDPKMARRLIVDMGIKPEKASPGHTICSIGFCEDNQLWYGWSHRAIFGFGIGYIVEEGDAVTESGWTDEYLVDHPEEDLRLPVGFEAKTMDDAKRLAIAFADSVG